MGGGPKTTTEAIALFGPVISAIGSGLFADTLQAAIRQAFGIDHITAMSFGPDAAPRALFYANGSSAGVMRGLTEHYTRGQYRQDPNFDLINQWRAPREPVVIQRGVDEFPRPYREMFFAKERIIEKLTVVSTIEGAPVALNLYATRDQGAFTPDQVARITLAAPIVSHAIVRHDRIHHGAHPAMPSAMDNAARLLNAAQQVGFTRRELEVCALILEGKSTTAIGMDLGVAPSSIATFRKNLYRKLKISSQAELFSLALGAVQSGETSPPS